MQIRKSLDKIVAIAGGCLVFATGGGTVAVGAGAAGSGAALFNAWREAKDKYGPECERILDQVRRKVRAELEANGALSEADEQILEGADFVLDTILLESIPPVSEIAQEFGRREGFAKAAAEKVLAKVAAQDELFAETGDCAQPLARRFALVAIEAAMDTALTNQGYFSRLLPFLLEAMSRETRAIREEVDRLNLGVEDVSADVKTLLKRLDESALGARAKREIGNDRPFIVLARKINQEVDDPHQALTELKAAVEIFLRRQSEAAQGSNLGQALDVALEGIAERSRRGDFSSAAREAERAFDRWQRDEAERRNAERQTGSRLIQVNIDQNILLRDPAAIALWVERQVVHDSEAPPRLPGALRDPIEEWHRNGERKGSNLDLEVAATLARRALQCSENPDDRGASFRLLGNALHRLGERESGLERLMEAVTAHRAALKQASRKRAPLDWARAQNCLGNALWRLGQREGKSARLRAAVAAYRAALKEWIRDLVPDDWATAQNNLGNALQSAAELGGAEGFDEAVAAYRAALEEWTRERSPLDWAMAQNNLGTAFFRRASGHGDVDQLEAAVAAFRLALEERTRERVPLDWAATQVNLGAALCALGRKETDTKRFEEALAAYRAALEEQTPERTPFSWANTQYNLGGALLRIGQRETGTARLEEAVAAFRAALSEQSRSRAPRLWASSQNNLGIALLEIGQREGGTFRLEEAATAFRAVLQVRREDFFASWSLESAVKEIAKRNAATAPSEESAASAVRDAHGRN